MPGVLQVQVLQVQVQPPPADVQYWREYLRGCGMRANSTADQAEFGSPY